MSLNSALIILMKIHFSSATDNWQRTTDSTDYQIQPVYYLSRKRVLAENESSIPSGTIPSSFF